MAPNLCIRDALLLVAMLALASKSSGMRVELEAWESNSKKDELEVVGSGAVFASHNISATTLVPKWPEGCNNEYIRGSASWKSCKFYRGRLWTEKGAEPKAKMFYGKIVKGQDGCACRHGFKYSHQNHKCEQCQPMLEPEPENADPNAAPGGPPYFTTRSSVAEYYREYAQWMNKQKLDDKRRDQPFSNLGDYEKDLFAEYALRGHEWNKAFIQEENEYTIDFGERAGKVTTFYEPKAKRAKGVKGKFDELTDALAKLPSYNSKNLVRKGNGKFPGIDAKGDFRPEPVSGTVYTVEQFLSTSKAEAEAGETHEIHIRTLPEGSLFKDISENSGDEDMSEVLGMIGVKLLFNFKAYVNDGTTYYSYIEVE